MQKHVHHTIFVPQMGRGAVGTTLTPNANYLYYGASYYGQPGWIYTGYGFAALGNTSGCGLQSTISPSVANYQVPSTLAPAPLYVPTSAVLPTSTLDCPQTLSCAGDFSLVRAMYDQFVYQFTAKYGRPPTVRDIVAITVEMEWLTSVTDPNVITYGSEGFARNYYNDCRRGTCTAGGLNVFLSAYSEWFQGMPLSKILDNYATYLTNQASIDAIVDNIITPVLVQGYDPSTGYASNRPWQWFSYTISAGCSQGSRRSVNDSATGVFYRLISTGNDTVFEIYTGAQNSNIQAVAPYSSTNPCRYTPTPTH